MEVDGEHIVDVLVLNNGFKQNDRHTTSNSTCGCLDSNFFMAASRLRFSIQHHGHKMSENSSMGTSSRSARVGEGIETGLPRAVAVCGKSSLSS